MLDDDEAATANTLKFLLLKPKDRKTCKLLSFEEPWSSGNFREAKWWGGAQVCIFRKWRRMQKLKQPVPVLFLYTVAAAAAAEDWQLIGGFLYVELWRVFLFKKKNVLKLFILRWLEKTWI